MNDENVQHRNNLNENKKSEPELEASQFSENIFENLPGFLKQVCSELPLSEKQVFLTGTLAVISSILPNICVRYNNRTLESNIYMFLVGAYGVGKGALKYCEQLALPIHLKLKERNTKLSNGEEGRNIKSLLFLPANSSKSGFIELLSVHQRGLIFETEADTLNDTLTKDFGTYSDILRCAYHHETYRYYRKTNQEFIEIPEPKLSLLISGTFGQLKRLIPSVENGLFSRLNYFQLKPDLTFSQSVFDNSNYDVLGKFYKIGSELIPLFDHLSEKIEKVIFSLQNDQQQDFLRYFTEKKRQLVDLYGDNIAGSVNRFAVQYLRIAMILTSLRYYYKSGASFGTNLYCQDQDFENTGKIMEVFIEHAICTFNSLPSFEKTDLPTDLINFLHDLPDIFHTFEAVDIGQQIGISETKVKRMLKDNKLFSKKNHGTYEKRQPQSNRRGSDNR